MLFLFLSLFAAAIVAVDQITKYVTVMNIAPSNATMQTMQTLKDTFDLTTKKLEAMPTEVDAIPGLFQFSHYHNQGGAWSLFDGMMWLFILAFAVLTVLIFIEYFKKPMGFSKFDRWCIAAIYAGGIGNMIDRIRLGFVVDMIKTQFIDFPIFNVADCFITCGCIALMISLFFFNKEFWKDEKK